MACDECEKNREMGRRFCTKCGDPLEPLTPSEPQVPMDDFECPECAKNKANGLKFCTSCGMQLVDDYVPQYSNNREEPSKTDSWWAVPIPSMIVLAAAIVFSLVCLFLYIGDVWRFVYDAKVSIYVFFIFEIDLGTITGQMAQYYWLFIAVAIVASSMLVLWFSRGILTGFRSPGYKERLEKTPLYSLGLLFGATLVIELALTIIIQGLGVDVSAPEVITEFTPVESAFYMARAAVWEEIAFRLVPFGLPMMVIALIMKRKDFPKYLFGGFGMSHIAFVLLVISSIVFAYAHVEGWGLWKMATVIIGSFVMGYLFARFGIYVTIVFHFITDYMLVWMDVNMSLGTVLELAILGLGLICIPLAVKKMVEGLSALKNEPLIAFDQDSSDSNKD